MCGYIVYKAYSISLVLLIIHYNISLNINLASTTFHFK